jgi:uncharacterized membrane protein YoaK (UPF0700 family)
MSFNGGLINAAGFLATGRFVSHVTGFATLFGVSTILRELKMALGILSVPFFFLLGAFLAGMLIDRPIYRKKKPYFDYVMGLSAFCLFLAASGGGLDQFGSFGAVLQLQKSYLLLCLLCLACGLQNGAISSSFGGSIRTTHLTGLTTDLGLGLAKILTFSSKDLSFQREIRIVRLRSYSMISFVLGSAVGAWIFLKLGYLGFVIPGLIACYTALYGRQIKKVSLSRKVSE